jgi:hypothetical protein
VGALLKQGVSQVSALAAFVEEKDNGVIILRADTLEKAQKLVEKDKIGSKAATAATRCRLHKSSPLEKVCWRDAWVHIMPLRFAVGTKVQCHIGDWLKGEVILLRYRQENWPRGRVAAYQVRLDNGELVYAPEDKDSMVRKQELSGMTEEIHEATQTYGLCDIPLDTLIALFDSHIKRMRYCSKCQDNVEDAFDIFIAEEEVVEADYSEEDYSVDIFAPYQILFNDESQLLRCDPLELPGLVERYKEESEVHEADSSKTRHAKNLREGQEEIMFMLGEYFERRIKQEYRAHLTAEHEKRLLVQFTLEAFRIKLGEVHQPADVVVWDEEELDSKTMTKTKNKKKNKKNTKNKKRNKKRQGKNNQDRDGDDSSLLPTVTAADALSSNADDMVFFSGSPTNKARPTNKTPTFNAASIAVSTESTKVPSSAPMCLFDVAASLDEDEDQNLLTSMGWFEFDGNEGAGSDGEVISLSMNEDEMAEELQGLLAERTRLRSRLRSDFKALLRTSPKAGKVRAPTRAPAKMQVNLNMSVLQPMASLETNGFSSAVRSMHCPCPPSAGSLKESKQAFARRRRS